MMDQTSHQPMLIGPTSGHVLEVESGKEGRKPMFVRSQSKIVLCCLAFFIFLTIVLLIALFMAVYELMAKDVCTTPQCLRSASSLTDSMDRTVDPCEDFNQFMCGNWAKNHLMHATLSKYSWFVEIKLKQEHSIQEFLEQEDSPDDPEAVVKARRLYRSCNDLESMVENGVVALNYAMTKSVGLPFMPPLGDSPPKQSWLRSVAKVKRFFDLDLIIGFAVAQRPENQSELRLLITYPKPSDFFELFRLDSKKSALSELEEARRSLMKPVLIKLLEYIPAVVEHSVTDIDKKLDKAADDILHVMMGLAQLGENENVARANQQMQFDEFRLKDLQSHVDGFAKGGRSKLKFKQFFNTIFEGIPGVKLDFDGIDTVLVTNQPYLEELTQFLDGISEHQLELYIWYQVLYNLGPHVNINLSILKRHIDEVGQETGITEPRSQFCQRATTALMESAVSYYLIGDPAIEEKREKVQNMLSELKETFLNYLLKDIEWMDPETKAKAAEKATAMKTYVAFLDKYKDKGVLDEEYKNITITEENYFDNVKRILSEANYRGLVRLREPFTIDMITLAMADVNAFYNPTANNIFVPGGILEFPLYDLGLEALNYGSIGVILGHELTHGFDDTGRKYDKVGNLLDWWTKEADLEFTKRAECYAKVYSNFTIPKINKEIDGELTLPENIADDGGLVESYHAYKRLLDENGEEQKLLGLEEFDSEHLFFMSFGHTWCVDHRDPETLEADLADTHSPELARTTLVLRNFKEFARVWSCPEGSRMNPAQETCKMWIN